MTLYLAEWKARVTMRPLSFFLPPPSSSIALCIKYQDVSPQLQYSTGALEIVRTADDGVVAMIKRYYYIVCSTYYLRRGVKTLRRELMSACHQMLVTKMD